MHNRPGFATNSNAVPFGIHAGGVKRSAAAAGIGEEAGRVLLAKHAKGSAGSRRGLEVQLPFAQDELGGREGVAAAAAEAVATAVVAGGGDGGGYVTDSSGYDDGREVPGGGDRGVDTAERELGFIVREIMPVVAADSENVTAAAAAAADKEQCEGLRGHPSRSSAAAASPEGLQRRTLAVGDEHVVRRAEEAAQGDGRLQGEAAGAEREEKLAAAGGDPRPNVKVASKLVADVAGDTEGVGKRAAAGGGPRPLVAKSIRCYGAKGSFTLPAAARR